MKIGSAFSGSYLKTPHLNGKNVVVTIARVEIEEVGNKDDDKKERKPVLYFAGKEMGLVLNKTNAGSISEILGTDETDEWTGKRIVLHPDKTDFGGRRVDCIRIKPAPTGKAAPAPPPPVEEEDTLAEEFHPSDDDVSFL